MDSLDAGWLGEPGAQIVVHFLYEVWRKAKKRRYRPEQFAISLENFLCTGFAPELAPLLAQAGWIGWDKEKNVLWLTAAGALALKNAREVQGHDGGSDSGIEAVIRVPTWWRRTRELYLGDELVRRLRSDAALAKAVLDACQGSGWAWEVRSPFADCGRKRVQMLTDALRTVNSEQRPTRLFFEARENSVYIRWMAV